MSHSNSKRRPTRATKQSDGDGPAERRRRIAEAAYYRAQRRAFVPGDEERDWLEAEREIDGDTRSA